MIALGLGRGQSLRVGVRDHELDAVQAGLDHVVDGVAAGATDAEDGDVRLEFPDVRSLQIDCHDLLPLLALVDVSVWPALPLVNSTLRRWPPHHRPTL